MGTLFISSMPRDHEGAAALRDALVRDGVSVVWDRDVPPGDEPEAWIREQVERANRVLVLWSEPALASATLRERANLAGDKLISVRLDPGLDLGSRPEPIVDLVDWPRPQHPGYLRLRERLARGPRVTPRTDPEVPLAGRSRSRVFFAMAGLWMVGTVLVAGLILLSRASDAPSGPAAREGFAPSVTVEFTDKRWIGEWPPQTWVDNVETDLQTRLQTRYDADGRSVAIEIEVGDLVAGRRPVIATAPLCEPVETAVRALDALDSTQNDRQHAAAATQIARQIAFCLSRDAER